MISPLARSRPILGSGAIVMAAAAIGGCESIPQMDGPPPRRVELAAFAHASPGESTAPTTVAHDGVADPPDGAVISNGSLHPLDTGIQPDAAPVQDSAGDGALATSDQATGDRASPTMIVPAVQPGERLIVDSFVGQVNGRPIFADEFFSPIADQLRALAERTTLREFESRAREIIAVRLRSLVSDALIIADAQAQLSTEQQQGLFYVLRMLREEAIAERGGTRAGTAQRLEEEEGISLDEYVATKRDQRLIESLYIDKILPRATYSWRDVELEYRRRYNEFNPPGRVRILRLRVPTAETERIDEAARRLASGEPFADVADSFGEPDGGTWQSFELSADGFEGLPLSDSVKRRLAGLDPGETSEPFEVGSSTWWLHIAEIERLPGRALHDPEVQRRLNELIRRRRMDEEEQRYLQSLLQRGIYDELSDMNEILARIAVLRYGPQ